MLSIPSNVIRLSLPRIALTQAKAMNDKILSLADQSTLKVDSLLDLKLSSIKLDNFETLLLQNGEEFLSILAFHVLISDLKGKHDTVEIQILRRDVMVLDRIFQFNRELDV